VPKIIRLELQPVTLTQLHIPVNPSAVMNYLICWYG